MRCVIVTGMSGAGKSTALKMLEDMGYLAEKNDKIGKKQKCPLATSYYG